MTWRGWLVAGVGLTGLGCADAPSDPLASETASIVGGEPSGAEDDGVLLIRALPEPDPEILCTASLVAPNLLLTARHCVSYFNNGLFTCTLKGEVVETTPDAGKLGLHLPAGSIEVYSAETPREEPIARGVDVISTLSPVICVNDIAFVVLDRALELPLVPMRLGRPAELHEAVTLVGYGMDGEQVEIPYETQPRRRKPDLEIAGVGPDLLEDGVTTVSPRSLIVDGPSGCVGDSGGPLRAAETGAVLGVYSLQEGGNCTSANVRHHLTHVPPFQALIAEAFTAAGSEPRLEPGSEPAPGSVGAGAGAGGAGPEPDPEGGAAGAVTDAPPHKSALDESGCSIAATNKTCGGSLLLLALLGLLCRRKRVAER
ncbi:MAG TPA: trypsin-like serine protease [Polyangiaceae bacterium]|nr:trypsin-like serine protease [Polyangiaceae bacterium]